MQQTLVELRAIVNGRGILVGVSQNDFRWFAMATFWSSSLPTRLLLLLMTVDFLTTAKSKKTYCHLDNLFAPANGDMQLLGMTAATMVSSASSWRESGAPCRTRALHALLLMWLVDNLDSWGW